MSKFHVNPNTGDVSVCKATQNCPFGDLEQDHYSDKEAARLAYEQKMSEPTEAAQAILEADAFQEAFNIEKARRQALARQQEVEAAEARLKQDIQDLVKEERQLELGYGRLTNDLPRASRWKRNKNSLEANFVNLKSFYDERLTHLKKTTLRAPHVSAKEDLTSHVYRGSGNDLVLSFSSNKTNENERRAHELLSGIMGSKNLKLKSEEELALVQKLKEHNPDKYYDQLLESYDG